MSQKRKLVKKFEIFLNQSGHLVIPKEDYYGRMEPVFDSYYETEKEAEDDLLKKGETYTDYIVLPTYRVEDF